MSPLDRCPPPDADCLWRVAGTSKIRGVFVRSVALVRAPTRDAALRIAQARFANLYTDLEIRGDPFETFAAATLRSRYYVVLATGGELGPFASYTEAELAQDGRAGSIVAR